MAQILQHNPVYANVRNRVVLGNVRKAADLDFVGRLVLTWYCLEDRLSRHSNTD